MTEDAEHNFACQSWSELDDWVQGLISLMKQGGSHVDLYYSKHVGDNSGYRYGVTQALRREY